jgi:hypothetical protein
MNGRERSPQLTILASTAVDPYEFCGIPILFLLARDAESNAGEGLAPCLRNLVATFRAMAQRGPARQLTLHALDTVFHCRVDLILHCAIASPTCGHAFPLAVPDPSYIDSSACFCKSAIASTIDIA